MPDHINPYATANLNKVSIINTMVCFFFKFEIAVQKLITAKDIFYSSSVTHLNHDNTTAFKIIVFTLTEIFLSENT